MSAEQGPNYALESWEDVKHRVVKIKSDLEVTKDEKFELQDELKTVRGQAEEVTVKHEYGIRQIDRLQYQVNQLQDEVHDLRNDKNRMSGELDCCKEENEKLIAQLELAKDAMAELQEANDDRRRQQQQINAMTTEKELLQTSLDRSNEERGRLADSLEELKTKCSTLQQELDKSKDDIARVQRELEIAETERGKLWERLEKEQDLQAKMVDDMMATAEELCNL